MRAYDLFCLTFSLLFVLPSCGEKKDPAAAMAGHWIILYPDHKLTSQHQREVYGRHQDSLVRLYGLKLITLNTDGSFLEADSLQRPPGKWISQDSLLKIREAGQGFNPFNTAYAGLQNGDALLLQYMPLEDEKIKIVWHLKKIENEEQVAALFSDEAVAWRKKPTAPESNAVLRKRLSAMVDYYAAYFALVGAEASYFSPARIPLPLNYYQHAVGLSPKMSDAFVALFYNQSEAAAAHRLLSQALDAERNNFPRDKNFVLEYGLFLKRLGLWLANSTADR